MKESEECTNEVEEFEEFTSKMKEFEECTNQVKQPEECIKVKESEKCGKIKESEECTSNTTQKIPKKRKRHLVCTYMQTCIYISVLLRVAMVTNFQVNDKTTDKLSVRAKVQSKNCVHLTRKKYLKSQLKRKLLR